MVEQLEGKSGVILAIAIFVAFAFTLSGCDSDSNSKAIAAPGTEIETFFIDPTRVFLDTRLAPGIEVINGVTKYTLNSDGTILFDSTTGGATTLNLDPGDIVIERPGAAAVTVIRFNE